MHLQTLRIRRFRNLADVHLTLPRGLLVLWGENAQGKTNIVESIYFLATGRSFRTTREEECLPHDAATGAAAVIEGEMIRGGIRHEIRVTFNRQSKTVRVNEKPLARLTDLWGVLATVLFTPDDLQTVLGGPSGRRQYMDVTLSQVDPVYLDALKRFSRALRQRNALLRRPPPLSSRCRGQVEAYEKPLTEAAARLLVGRRDFVARISALAARRHLDLAGCEERLACRYDHFLEPLLDDGPEASIVSLAEQDAARLYAALLARRREDDILRQQTLSGPHRDDVVLSVDDREARYFASQGQARTAALSLRLAEVDFIREAVGHVPLLLLDDILSELDPQRLRSLLSSLAEADLQIILTTTDLEPLRPVLARAAAWKVLHGRVEESGTENRPD